jgi:tRNA(fMet)-specific endonuclease VapC
LILDTNGLSALVEGDRSLEPLLRRVARLAIPVIVLGEFRYGILHSRSHRDYVQWLHDYLSEFQILDIEVRTTIPYAAIRSQLRAAGTPIPSNDVWIAALSRQHSLPIISRDRHFDLVPGIKRVEW